MSETSPAILAVSRRVIAREMAACVADADCAPYLDALFSKLQAVTAAMVGDLGYFTLLRRAARLARRTHAWLPVMAEAFPPVAPAFPRVQWSTYVEQVGHEEALACAAHLFATVLGLLASFIGEDFTFRLIRRAWPEAQSATCRFGAGES